MSSYTLVMSCLLRNVFSVFNLILCWGKSKATEKERKTSCSFQRDGKAFEYKSATPHEQLRDVYKIFYTLHESYRRGSKRKTKKETENENLWDCLGQFSWS